MKVDKQIFFNLNMHQLEAEKLLMLFEDISSGDMPDWVKKLAGKYIDELKRAGVE